MHFASSIRPLYFHTSPNLAISHEMLTLSLATQHKNLLEYVNVGIFCKNSCKVTTVMIGVNRGNLAGVVSSHSDGDESILAGCSPK